MDFPHPDEQRKIADFLSAIDTKIDLVGQELGHAQAFKKRVLSLNKWLHILWGY